jgi:hypothetical protein
MLRQLLRRGGSTARVQPSECWKAVAEGDPVHPDASRSANAVGERVNPYPLAVSDRAQAEDRHESRLIERSECRPGRDDRIEAGGSSLHRRFETRRSSAGTLPDGTPMFGPTATSYPYSLGYR